MDPLRLRVMAIFALHAVCVGGMFSRIAEVQRALGLTEAAFGLVLTGIPCGVLAGTLVVSRLIERLGTRATLLGAFPLFALSLPAVGLAAAPLPLWLSLFAYGLFLSLANVPMNVEADRVALRTGRSMLLKCHGFWGVGFLVTSGAAALAIRAGVSPMAQFVTVLAAVCLLTLLVVGTLAESPPRPFSRTGRAPRFALPDRTTLLVMAFALSGIVFEGVTRQWSVIYLRDTMGAADWIAALTLPAAVATQTAGRFLGDFAIDRIGERALGRLLAATTLAGGLLFVQGASIRAAFAGCLLIGLGISIVHPLGAAATARAGNRPASEAVAAFSSLQTMVGFTAPVVFGLIAEAGGLRLAVAAILPLPLMSWYFSRVLLPRAPAAVPG